VLFADPKAPDALPILDLHRGHDGHVTFHAKDQEGTFRDLGAIPARELLTWFPSFVEELERDSYFSVNGYYRGHPYKKSTVNKGLPQAWRAKKGLRWLTAAFVDVDSDRLAGMTAGQAIGAAYDLQERGEIPPVSLYFRSGRGVWLFWFLKNGERNDGPTDGPVRAWPDKVSRWNRVQRKLLVKTARLGADANALDVSRVSRVPGSVNTAAPTPGTRVRYLIPAGDDGKPFVYTLAELETAVGLEPPRNPRVVGEVHRQLKEGHGRPGQVGSWVKLILSFQLLRSLREGFREGHREKACWYWGLLLQRCPTLDTDEDIPRCTPEEMEAEVRQLASECMSADGTQPAPLPEKDVLAALESLEVKRPLTLRPSNDRFSDDLDITPDEAEFIRANGGSPTIRAAARFRGQEPEPKRKVTRAEKAEARRDFIARLYARNGEVPTLRELAAIIEDEAPELRATQATLMKDLVALGIQNPRRKGRAEEAPRLPM